MSGVFAVRREKVNGKIRELHDELARDEQQERCKCSMHLALFASSHLTAFLLHTDCAYVVSYSCSIFLSDKATWRLLTRTQSAKLTVKSIAFSIGVSDEDFDLLKSAIGDGHGDNDATTNGKRRNSRTRLGHTLQLGWEYYSIAKIVDIGENIVGAAKVVAMLHLQNPPTSCKIMR